MRKTPTIRTSSGKMVNPFDMKVEDVDPKDIAHALANICRYNGHTKFHYSVGQHVCLLYDQGPDDLKAQLLHHDDPEAYVGDLVAPLKHTPQFAFYRMMEDDIWEVIAERFDLPSVLDRRVHELDKAIRKREMLDLHNHEIAASHLGRNNRYADFPFAKITPWTPGKAKNEYLLRLRDLGQL